MKKIIWVVVVLALLGCLHVVFSSRKLGNEESYKSLHGVALGKKVYEDLRCDSCHSTDGSEKTGGTLKAIFDTEAEFEGGTKAKRDEAYLKEAILNPKAKIVKGRADSMTPFQSIFFPEGEPSREKELQALIDYLKSLK